MKHKIKWVVSPYRKKYKVYGARQPIKPSEYFKYLCKVGAGFDVDVSKQRFKK